MQHLGMGQDLKYEIVMSSPGELGPSSADIVSLSLPFVGRSLRARHIPTSFNFSHKHCGV